MKNGFHRPLLWATVFVLCALHAWMAASVSRTFSTTSDEIAHLTSGYAYWTLGDYRLQPENGNFPQRWAVLPLLCMDLKFPDQQGEHWVTANIWKLGYDFLYQLGNDSGTMLAYGRAMIAVLSALTCLLIYLWTRELFGPGAAFVSLVLAVFAPEMLAHAGLATSESAATLGFVVALLSWWRLLHRVTLSRIFAAGLCAGFLAVSKHSVVLFAPIAILMATIRLIRPAPLRIMLGGRLRTMSGWRRLPVCAVLLMASAAICAGVIWASFGFRYSAAPLTYANAVDFALPWEDVMLERPTKELIPDDNGEIVDRRPGVVQHFVRFARDYRLLPEAWLYGLAFVEKNSRARLAFFCGDYRRTGWREFFPVAFVLKTTLPVLILTSAGLLCIVTVGRRRRVALLYRTSPLLVLLAVYWTFSIQSKLNIGHRHLLPTYPACYILAGAAVLKFGGRGRRPAEIAIIGLLGWHLVASVGTRPDYLAYFNPLSGDPMEAHRLFVDSSLDWGQDLPRLREWLETNAAKSPVFISYFGSGSPPGEGINAIRLGDGYFDWAPRRTPPPLTGGFYCISATMFRRVYTHVRGPWTSKYEDKYQALKAWIGYLGRKAPGSAPTNMDGTPLGEGELHARLFEYEQLQFGRLCHFIQFRKPDGRAGRSFLIYRLNDEEVAFALHAPLPDLNAFVLRP